MSLIYMRTSACFSRELPSLLLTTFYRKHTVSSCIKPRYICIVLEKMPMAEEISFGEMLRLERKRLGWTQEELADKLGDKAFCNNDSGDPVTRQTIARWERGSHFPFPHNLKNLVTALGLDQKGINAFFRAASQAPPEIIYVPAAEQPPEQIQQPPEIFHVPPLRNRFFTGRERYLEELRKLLQEDGIVSITGLGGIGKTQIALEYAQNSHPDMYRTVLWVNASDTATLQRDYNRVARRWGCRREMKAIQSYV